MNQDIVYIYLFHESDDDGVMDATGVAIAKVLALSVRTVQYSLRKLEEKNLIQRLQRGRYAVTDKAERADIDEAL
jgi:predicted transcriptional regulator